MITRSILLSEEKVSEFDLKKVNMNEQTPIRFNYIAFAFYDLIFAFYCVSRLQK